MANRVFLSKQLRSNRLWAIAAVLLVAQALVPNGFMPVFAKDGPSIMLCTGQGLQRTTLGPDASEAMHALADAMGDDETPDTDNTPCDYAAAGNAVAKPSTVAPAHVPIAWDSGTFPAAGLVAIGAGLAAPPPPQTGPPLTF